LLHLVDQFQVRAEFKRRLEKNEVSERHSESLSETLRKLETRFGEQLVSEIQTEDIREWLSGLPLATKTRNKPRGYAGQVFNLAIDYGYLPANPVTKNKRFNERSTEDDEISILSADETEQLFRAADPAVIPSDALLLLRSPGRHSRTSFVGRCKVRRTAGDCSQV
jgi:hypothetical protein